MVKVYYKIRFSLESALSLGSGKNDNTDKDLLVDSRGIPFIPGTSLAGIYRALFEQETASEYFGDVVINTSTRDTDFPNAKESRILIYDAYPVGKTRISKRDCVGLDEYKTAIPGAKFDFEILEPGCEMITYIEQNLETEDEMDLGAVICSTWKKNGLEIGSKTFRGYGKTRPVEILRAEFDLSKQEELEKWICFSMYGEEQYSAFSAKKDLSVLRGKEVNIELSLKQVGGIAIRQYSTSVSQKGGEQPDYEQMYYLRGDDYRKKKIPVIPGTSWAGAFRHSMSTWGKEEEITELFGSLNKKSKIRFSESEIGGKGLKSKMITRNAIERYTQGPKDTALYMEKSYFGGETTLEISIATDVLTDSVKRLLAASIADLHSGMLAIGGLTSVGRGIFQIKDISIGNTFNSEKTHFEIEGKNSDELQPEESMAIFKYIVQNL